MTKLTKQGVLDLDSIGPKKPKKKVELPPESAFVCDRHQFKYLPIGDQECTRCGLILDWNGDVY